MGTHERLAPRAAVISDHFVRTLVTVVQLEVFGESAHLLIYAKMLTTSDWIEHEEVTRLVAHLPATPVVISTAAIAYRSRSTLFKVIDAAQPIVQTSQIVPRPP